MASAISAPVGTRRDQVTYVRQIADQCLVDKRIGIIGPLPTKCLPAGRRARAHAALTSPLKVPSNGCADISRLIPYGGTYSSNPLASSAGLMRTSVWHHLRSSAGFTDTFPVPRAPPRSCLSMHKCGVCIVGVASAPSPFDADRPARKPSIGVHQARQRISSLAGEGFNGARDSASVRLNRNKMRGAAP